MGEPTDDEKTQAEALAKLGRAMKRWGIKPEQLQSPARELMAFDPDPHALRDIEATEFAVKYQATLRAALSSDEIVVAWDPVAAKMQVRYDGTDARVKAALAAMIERARQKRGG